MNDMSGVIIPKSDQWNADDFLSGPRTFTIKAVQIRGGEEQPVNISLEGSDKFYRPCKSMSRCLVHAWGPDASKYIGRSLTLYCDPKVKWGGMEVGGIRISHLSHIDRETVMALTATKGSRKPFIVKPLVPPARTEQPSSKEPKQPRGIDLLDGKGTVTTYPNAAEWLAALATKMDEAESAASVLSPNEAILGKISQKAVLNGDTYIQEAINQIWARAPKTETEETQTAGSGAGNGKREI